MTDRYRDNNGAPIGGYDTPLNAPDGYADFTYTPTAAAIAAYDARVVYNRAMLDALQDMPLRIKALSNKSVSLLLYGDPAEGARLGREVQDWRDMALEDARRAIERGDYGDAAMNYAIARACRDD